MPLLLDSSVLITAERRGIDLPDMPINRSLGLCASTITVSELLHGLHNARTEEQRSRRQMFYDSIVEGVTILAFDFESAVVHADVWSALRNSGTIIGPHDLIIAATALAHGHAVVTDNVREFARVPGLQMIQPAW